MGPQNDGYNIEFEENKFDKMWPTYSVFHSLKKLTCLNLAMAAHFWALATVPNNSCFKSDQKWLKYLLYSLV